jgi:hypothetical protein
VYVDGPAGSSALGSSASPAALNGQWQSRPPAQGPGARQELRDPVQRSCPPSPSLGSVNGSVSHANGPGLGNGWYSAQGGSAFLAMSDALGQSLPSDCDAQFSGGRTATRNYSSHHYHEQMALASPSATGPAAYWPPPSQYHQQQQQQQLANQYQFPQPRLLPSPPYACSNAAPQVTGGATGRAASESFAHASTVATVPRASSGAPNCRSTAVATDPTGHGSCNGGAQLKIGVVGLEAVDPERRPLPEWVAPLSASALLQLGVPAREVAQLVDLQTFLLRNVRECLTFCDLR